MRKIINGKKKEVINLLHKKLGIKVDTPKQGFRSTDDGNTARTFFNNCSIVASITDITFLKK